MGFEREDLDVGDGVHLLVEMMSEGEVLCYGVILQASIQDLNHVILLGTSEHFEVFQITNMSLLVLSKRDVRQYSGSLQLQHQVLWRGVGVGRPSKELLSSSRSTQISLRRSGETL